MNKVDSIPPAVVWLVQKKVGSMLCILVTTLIPYDVLT